MSESFLGLAGIVLLCFHATEARAWVDSWLVSLPENSS